MVRPPPHPYPQPHSATRLSATTPPPAGPPECNCNAIRLSPADVPVRDVDGVIYANLCLARCQHADIDTTREHRTAPVQNGRSTINVPVMVHITHAFDSLKATLPSCTAVPTVAVSGAAGGGAAPYNPRLIDAQAALGPADLTRYSAEGFRLVAKIKMQAGKAWTPRLAR